MIKKAINSKALEIVLAHLRLDCTATQLEIATMMKERARYYWPNSDVKSSEFVARFPDSGCLIEMARQCLAGRVQFWQPWHMEMTPKPEKVGKRIKWTAMPNGDEEWSHALVRFTHMIDLAAGYRLTGKSSFLRTYRNHLKEFFQARLHRSSLWDNRLDSALRLLNLIRSYDLIRNDNDIVESDHIAVLALCTVEAQLLDSKLGSRVGNWEFFISTSLLTAAVYLENVFDTANWRQRASDRLKEVIQSEILADGNLIEQVPMYHGECVLAMLDYLLAEKANGAPLSPQVVEAVKKMSRILTRISDPRGRIPAIGDSDSFDVDYIVKFGEAVLGSEFKREVAPADVTISPETVAVDLLEETGWTMVRWQTIGEGTGYLLLDLSGKPASGREGHSHADDLQFIFHTNQTNVLVDPGRFTYTPIFMSELNFLPWRLKLRSEFQRFYSALRPRFRDLNERNWHRYFRHTLRHNTISRGGENQAGYDDSPTVTATVTSEKLLHEGPLLLCRGKLESTADYSHTRDFICHVPHFLIIVDRLSAKSLESWIASFHLGPDFEATVTDGAGFMRSVSGDYTYSVSFREAFGTNLSVSVEDDWVSPVYNTKVPSKTIKVTVPSCSESILITVFALEPQKSGENRATIGIDAIGRGKEAASAKFAVTYRSALTEIDAYLALDRGILKSSDLSSDAYYTAVCERRGGGRKVGFLEGNYVEIGRNRYTSVQGKGSLYQSV